MKRTLFIIRSASTPFILCVDFAFIFGVYHSFCRNAPETYHGLFQPWQAARARPGREPRKSRKCGTFGAAPGAQKEIQIAGRQFLQKSDRSRCGTETHRTRRLSGSENSLFYLKINKFILIEFENKIL